MKEKEEKKQKCCKKGCKGKVEFDFPNDLCRAHWKLWFNWKIEVRAKNKTKTIDVDKE